MLLGETVPNFKADTTKGTIQFYDWQGDAWVVLFSHPADFTPVCTTELSRIAVHQPEFAKRNTKLIAHSVDSVKSHADWVTDIKSYCPDISGEFPYPIIGDPNRELAVSLFLCDKAIKNDPQIGRTVRALYIISPDHTVRLSIFYPMSTGRNVDEILRCIDSLQLVDRFQLVATPANWTPGTEIVISPQMSDEDVKKIFPKGIDEVTLPSGMNYVRTTENY